MGDIPFHLTTFFVPEKMAMERRSTPFMLHSKKENEKMLRSASFHWFCILNILTACPLAEQVTTSATQAEEPAVTSDSTTQMASSTTGELVPTTSGADEPTPPVTTFPPPEMPSSGSGGQTEDHCFQQFVYCDVFGGCPEGDPNKPLTNWEVLRNFMQQTINEDLINECYQGDWSYMDLATYMRVIDPDTFQPDMAATFCFYDFLYTKIDFLREYHVQFSLSEEQPEEVIKLGEQEWYDVAYYDFCGAINLGDYGKGLQFITLLNDLGEGQQEAPMLKFALALHSFEKADYLIPAGPEYINTGKAEITTLNGAVEGGAKGKLVIQVQLSSMAKLGDQFRVGVVDTKYTSLFGSFDWPLHTIE